MFTLHTNETVYPLIYADRGETSPLPIEIIGQRSYAVKHIVEQVKIRLNHKDKPCILKIESQGKSQFFNNIKSQNFIKSFDSLTQFLKHP